MRHPAMPSVTDLELRGVAPVLGCQRGVMCSKTDSRYVPLVDTPSEPLAWSRGDWWSNL